MVAALAPVLDQGPAIAAALVSRLVVSVGDLVCAALAGAAAKAAIRWNGAGGPGPAGPEGAPDPEPGPHPGERHPVRPGADRDPARGDESR